MGKIILLLLSLMTFATSMAQDDVVMTCPDDNHPHAIDLGLPSGTKWACCNVGADKPEAYGGYYAWGETEEKAIYDWASYTLCDGFINTLQNLGSDIAGTGYDVAHVKWGGAWVMPSRDRIEELYYNCTCEWTTVNGVEGVKFTSEKNGGTIFLPAAGQRWKSEPPSRNVGFYWTSSQLENWVDEAYSLLFFASEGVLDYNFRGVGFSVRPILSTTSNINLSESSSYKSNQAIYNLYGIKVADSTADMNTLHPGIYIVNGKKFIYK